MEEVLLFSSELKKNNSPVNRSTEMEAKKVQIRLESIPTLATDLTKQTMHENAKKKTRAADLFMSANNGARVSKSGMSGRRSADTDDGINRFGHRAEGEEGHAEDGVWRCCR
ncbi:hypothetical protein CDL15_Pgr021020 [Punica granatum]|uniref:Uncharacterized protein n=1 Tax=Punica granatum TaxID=22663 RepID=A0A218Y036_PUNGR|nr:hypothetical protein CDL15_Pgr021020 [Punica granatum]